MKLNKTAAATPSLLLCTFLLVATAQAADSTGASTGPGATSAHAELTPASGSEVHARARLTPMAGGVHLELDAQGLKPGVHGFHIHEVGDCSAPDASSAKGHFNPAGAAHGHHAGDLPDLSTDASGNGRVLADLAGLSLEAGPGGILGRALVIHADPDDHASQPAGNAGKRVACGVIRAG
jgi:Cu-Zn family superoxide dismutase